MPSLPESGPTRMSTFSCSTSRRASSTALSGVASDPPYTISIGWPAMTALLTPSVGSPLTGVAPRSMSGSIAPPHVWPSNGANGPSLLEKTPILIASPVAWPPVVAPPVCAAPSSSPPPHPAAIVASAITRAANRIQSRLGRPSPGFRMFPPLLGFSRFPGLSPGGLAGGRVGARVGSSFVLGDDGRVAGRVALLGEGEGVRVPACCSPPEARLERAGGGAPDAHEPPGRHENDREEDHSDDSVEAVSDQIDATKPVVQHGHDDRPHPGSLEPVEAADDRDNKDIDGLGKRNRAWRDPRVPPDGENAGETCDESAKAEGNRAQERDVVAERTHAGRVVTHPLEREAQWRSGDVAQRNVDGGRDHERDVEEARRLLQRVPDYRGELDIVHAPEPRELGHLREEEVHQHRECERDHEEVDSVAPARDRSQKEADRHRRT